MSTFDLHKLHKCLHLWYKKVLNSSLLSKRGLKVALQLHSVHQYCIIYSLCDQYSLIYSFVWPTFHKSTSMLHCCFWIVQLSGLSTTLGQPRLQLDTLQQTHQSAIRLPTPPSANRKTIFLFVQVVCGELSLWCLLQADWTVGWIGDPEQWSPNSELFHSLLRWVRGGVGCFSFGFVSSIEHLLSLRLFGGGWRSHWEP